jgi:uncharacterized protein YbjQ (UPF0145 family)
MIVVTTDTVAGMRIVKALGLARGNTIRARSIGRDVQAALSHFVGGEIIEYSKLMAEAREQALDRMTEQARQLGANAVVGFRFATCEVMGGAAEILAYGTAVVVEEDG